MPPVPKPVRIRDRAAIERARKPWCEWCWDIFAPRHVHHIRTRGAGGSDVDENLICLCWVCHAAAHSGRIAAADLRARKAEILAGKWDWKIRHLARRR